jgi:hypothetical protein
MRRLLLALLILAGPVGATITAGNALTGDSSLCNSGTTNCVYPSITTVTVHAFRFAFFAMNNNASVLSGVTSTNGDFWVLGSCAASEAGAFTAINCAYVADSLGGSSDIVTGSLGTPNTGRIIFYGDWTRTGTGFTVTVAAADRPTSATTQLGITPTGSTNALLIQCSIANNVFSSIDQSYVVATGGVITRNCATLTNTTNFTQPTWTMTGAGVMAVMGLSAIETSASGHIKHKVTGGV